MKKKSTSKSAFFNVRVLIASVFCLVGVFVALIGSGAFAQTKGPKNNQSARNQDAPGTQTPDVVQMVGPVMLTTDLRNLPYVPNEGEMEDQPLTRYPHPKTGASDASAPSFPSFQSLLKRFFAFTPSMPPPLLTFDGISFSQSGCGCFPPDTNGDVGPLHYVQSVNVRFAVYDKSGATLLPPTTFNSFFAPLTGTPCASQNRGDPFVFFDQLANRWVITDFAFASFPGTNFYECIGVSQSPDPVVGPWALYALLVDATHLDDYPKLAMWPNPQPGGAYHLTVNLFLNQTTFNGVKVFALDRASMLTGGPANAISFLIPPAGLGDSYSLVPAGFRTGDPPPVGRDEMLLAVDSPANSGVTLTQVHAWRFHVDFVTPANSTIGVGANHSPDAQITVNPFVDAFNPGFNIVPQQGTATKLDTLGDKIMTPMVYQNRTGTESLWADQTVILNFPTGPTAVRWYQFDVTGGIFPATALQQQDWSNGNDGLWRFMTSIAVDQNGNTAIGYSTSSTTIFPSIRYAGRLASDPPSNLGQGEAIMTPGGGSQTGGSRWGDYTMTTIDPANGTDFWHTNEYYPATAGVNWFTKVGKFNFAGGASPTPTPTASPTCTPGWSPAANLPSAGVRFVGVFFPANGKFYAMGGRDASDVEFMHPFEYDPATNMWTTKSASYPDANTNNMACSVLTDAGTPYIYCVGGSNFAAQTVTGRVFRYNPVTDSISVVAAPWPDGTAGTLPGGFSVFNNKLYILGGFNVAGGNGTSAIWEFTPGTNIWLLKTAALPVPLGYIPTTTIGSLIYTGGGADITGGTLTDTTNSFKYDPVADSITTITAIPRATSNTRGLNLNGKMWVPGGQFPTPSNEVDIYDPVLNSWSLGPPMLTARRNSAMDTDGTSHIWAAGGYDDTGVANGTTEVLSQCGTPSPTPTSTPTATATVTASATPTATATATATTPPPTPTATATATATATIPPSPTPTATAPRITPTPRPRPTPPPRP